MNNHEPHFLVQLKKWAEENHCVGLNEFEILQEWLASQYKKCEDRYD